METTKSSSSGQTETRAKLKILLKPFQDAFIFSQTRHPAFIAAWATGKTMCGILRGMLYSEGIPENLGIIFRKEYTDLRDSTLKDFERYTGLKCDSQRNVNFANGSQIMFRHVEELNNLQNINLGWFFIEQAEELRTDNEFFLLWGRLRRELNPTSSFLDLNLPTRSGFMTGNVKASNWIKHFWKDKPDQGFELTEATTYDNADVLPQDYLDSLERLKVLKPDVYRRFVLNDWGVETEGKAFKSELIDACIGGNFEDPQLGADYVLGTDLGKYSSYTTIFVIKLNVKPSPVVYFDRFKNLRWSSKDLRVDTTEKRIKDIALRYNNALVIPDSTGVGDPVVEGLEDLGLRIYREDKRLGFVFTEKSKEQLIDNLVLVIENGEIRIPDIEVVIGELKDLEVEDRGLSRKYFVPEGKFSDCVMGLGLCCWGMPKPEAFYLQNVGPKRESVSAMRDF